MKNSYISNFKPAQKYRVKKRHIYIFFALIILSLACLELLNRYFIVHKSKHYLTLCDFETVKDKIEILFLGDSHFKLGIDSAKFRKPVYNLSFSNASYISSYYILKRFIDEMPKLKVVILPLDLHNFSSFRNTDILEAIFWNQFVDHSELARISHEKLRRKILNLTLLSPEFGRVNFWINLKEFIKEKMRMKLSDPAETENEPPSGDLNQKAFEKIKQHFVGSTPFDETQTVYFQKILNLSKEHHFKVITLQMPVSQFYLDNAEKYITRQEIQSKILEKEPFKTLIDKNFDFTGLYGDRIEYFSWGRRDGDHLNQKGKDEFSILIASKIEEL